MLAKAGEISGLRLVGLSWPKLICALFAGLFYSSIVFSQVTIWSEDFNSYLDGTMNATKWTSTATDCDDGTILQVLGSSYWGVNGGRFTVNDIEGAPCCTQGGANGNYWTSELITISGYCNISISFDVSSAGPMECDNVVSPIFACMSSTPPDNSQDQVVGEYSLNGGPFTRFPNFACGSFSGSLSITGLNGNNIRIRISAANKANDEFYYFDNILVRGFTASPITITGVPNQICNTAGPFTLPTTVSGTTGNWSGTNVVGNQFFPVLLGDNQITFTPTSCGGAANWVIKVVPSIPVTASNNSPICGGETLLLFADTISGAGYSWSGPASFSSGIQNPTRSPAASFMSGTYTVMVSVGGCTSSASTTVTINQEPQAFSYNTPPICNSGTGIYLNLRDYDAPVKNNGPGIVNWYFDGGATNSIARPDSFLVSDTLIVYARVNNSGCQSSVVPVRLNVSRSKIPNIKTTALCRNTGVFDLRTLRDSSFLSGTFSWTGPINGSGNFFNTAMPAGSYTLTFTASGACVLPATVSLPLNNPGPVVFTDLPSSICNSTGTYILKTTQSGVKGKWSGNYVSSDSVFNPPLSFSGKVGLTFTPVAGPCVTANTDSVFVQNLSTISITGVLDSICRNAAPLALSTTQSGFSGQWSGTGVSGNQFNPAGLSDLHFLFFTPNPGQCASPTNKKIYIKVPVKPVITGVRQNYCQRDTAVVLPTIQSGISGTWSGSGVSTNKFNPAGLKDTVVLKFTPTGTICADTNTIAVFVSTLVKPKLDSADLCRSEAPINLSKLTDPAYPSGKWSGIGVDTTTNTFNPAGKAGNYTLTFTSSASCVTPVQTQISVRIPAIPQLKKDTLCQNGSPIVLSKLLDPAYTVGTWGGLGVKNDTFSPAGLTGNIPLTFQSSLNCTETGSTIIKVNSAPMVAGLTENCNPATQQYTVQFSIQSGDSTSYKVNGVPSGKTYTSVPKASNSTYTFTVDDRFGCKPVVLTGSANCSCITSAGTMDFTGSPFKFCEGSNVILKHNSNNVLEPNDTLIFVLHDAPGTTLGNVLAKSKIPTFSYPNAAVSGTTYYVSAVAGDKIGSDSLDLGDPCLSISQGVPVTFYKPSFTVSAGDTVCQGSCHYYTFTFNGVAPFQLVYELNSNGFPQNDTITTDSNTFRLLVCAVGPGTIVLTPLQFKDMNCAIVPGTNDIRTLVSNPRTTYNLNEWLCPGESRVVNNKVYDAANPSGTEVLAGQNIWGCDSIVNINLKYFAPAEYRLDSTLCQGQSIVVNGVTYDETKHTGTEILKGRSYTGCDSIVHINLNFISNVSYMLSQTLCPTDSVIVNGKKYDISNATGVEKIIGGSYLGCDSTVIVSLGFFAPTIRNMNLTLCQEDSVILRGQVFNKARPYGTVILPKQNHYGCDSIVNVNLSFYPSPSKLFNQTLCPGDSLVVNGKVYNQTNPSGTEILRRAGMNGCDSTVYISPGFYAPSIRNLNQTICRSDSLVVNGVAYKFTRPSGTEILKGKASNGCDSIVNVQLNFFPAAIHNLSQTLCENDSIELHGRVFKKNQATGTVILQKSAYLGCDSTINVSLSLRSTSTTTLSPRLCPGDSVLVNGKVYNQLKPSGTEIIKGGNASGCDSTVNVNLTFFTPVVNNVNRQLCPGGLIVVNNVKYDAFNPKGTEVLKKAAANGCDSVVNINLTYGSAVIVNLNRTLCHGDSIRVKNTWYSSLKPTGRDTFPGGSYLGCDSIVNVSLAFYPKVNGVIDTTLKPGQSLVVNNTVYSQQKTSGSEVIKGGSYTGCDSTVAVQLRFAGLFEPKITVKSPLCRGRKDGSITIDTIIGGVKPFVVALNGANSKQVFSFPFAYTGLTGGIQQLTIQDNAGVSIAQDILIDEPATLLLELGANVTVPLGQDYTIKPQTSFTPAKWAWSPSDFLSCSDCANPVVRNPNRDITYTLVATDAKGCTVTDRITIFVNRARTIFVPNTFSPNGDGINDQLVVFGGKEVLRVNTFKIFSRWGNLLYEAYDFLPNDFNMGWDGTHRGDKVNSGLYTWFAQIEFVDGQTELFEGGVHLLR